MRKKKERLYDSLCHPEIMASSRRWLRHSDSFTLTYLDHAGSYEMSICYSFNSFISHPVFFFNLDLKIRILRLTLEYEQHSYPDSLDFLIEYNGCQARK